MKITSNVLKAIMAGAMVMSSVSVHAGEVSTMQVSAAMQEATAARIVDLYKSVKDRQDQLAEFRKNVRIAKMGKAGIQVVYNTASENSYVKYGYGLTTVIGLGRLAISIFPASEFYRNARKPFNMAITIGGVLVLAGTGVLAGSSFVIEKADSYVAEMEGNIQTVQGLIEMDKQNIMIQAATLGAKIENKVVTFDGLPEGVKAVGVPGVMDLR